MNLEESELKLSTVSSENSSVMEGDGKSVEEVLTRLSLSLDDGSQSISREEGIEQ